MTRTADHTDLTGAGVQQELRMVRGVAVTLSPDLNPIEHLWGELKRRVRARDRATSSNDELKSALEEEWNTIPQDFMKKLIKSMKNRIKPL
ncbi:unnamed protein product [Euphydryas editha]|uniref:Tc1-like transposase DDE domain-containing protein n=1 Tax=Euphydryas editha TaxID=104508 RepID=A0AAU9VA79_EUPED|nr:unnamed protein product [Euphydryas editha]